MKNICIKNKNILKTKKFSEKGVNSSWILCLMYCDILF